MDRAHQGTALQRLLSNEDLRRLEQSSSALRAAPGTMLFDIGSVDPQDVVLLEGEVELRSGDGGAVRIRGGTDAARLPLARLRPRRYRGTSVTAIRYLKVPAQALTAVFDPDAVPHVVAGYEVSELLQGEGPDAEDLVIHFAAAVREDAIRLPSLPLVAAEVREALEAEDLGTEQVARIVMRDAPIAAKVVRVANSPFYRGENPCASVAQAVSRIGLARTQELVMSFALKEVFECSVPALSGRMREAWKHTQLIAGAAFAMARVHGKCHPERLLLAGVLHDIGIVALLAHAEQVPAVWDDAETLERVLGELKSEVGVMMLSRWGFDALLVQLVKDVDAWKRAGSNECDVLQTVHWCLHHLEGGKLEAPAAVARVSIRTDELLELVKSARDENVLFDDAKTPP